MQLLQNDFCCAVGVLGDFPDDTTVNWRTRKHYTEKEIRAELIQDWMFNLTDLLTYDSCSPYSIYTATTNSRCQAMTEALLKEWGFTCFTFPSVQSNDTLRFWKRKGLPKEIYKLIHKKWLAERENL